MDDELLRQVMRQIRAISCNTIQQIAAQQAGTLEGPSLRWSTVFLEIAGLADQVLAEHDSATPLDQRGFGT